MIVGRESCAGAPVAEAVAPIKVIVRAATNERTTMHSLCHQPVFAWSRDAVKSGKMER
jgi:hypothetical protein